jgi:hypothetical protein
MQVIPPYCTDAETLGYYLFAYEEIQFHDAMPKVDIEQKRHLCSDAVST